MSLDAAPAVFEWRVELDAGFRLPAPDDPDRRASAWQGYRVRYREQGSRRPWRSFLLESSVYPSDAVLAIAVETHAGRRG